MKTVPTITATVYCGLKNRDTGTVRTLEDAIAVCQRYVDMIGLCVTVTPTEFIYTDGREPGVAVGLIHYPRFPSDYRTIRAHAENIARHLLVELEQFRVTVVMGDETFMLSDDEKDLT